MLTQKETSVYISIYTTIFVCISLGATVASADFAIAMIGRREHLSRSRHEPRRTRTAQAVLFNF